MKKTKPTQLKPSEQIKEVILFGGHHDGKLWTTTADKKELDIDHKEVIYTLDESIGKFIAKEKTYRYHYVQHPDALYHTSFYLVSKTRIKNQKKMTKAEYKKYGIPTFEEIAARDYKPLGQIVNDTELG